MLFRIKRRGGEMQDVPAAVSSEGVITLRKEEVPADAESVSFHDDFFTAREGDSGFFLIPSHYYCHDTMLTEFRKREDTEAAYRYNDMPLYASAKETGAVLAVVSGMDMDYELVVGVKDGVYYIYPHFTLESGPFEDFVIRYFRLEGEGASPAGLARRYRKYQLERGACRPMRERVKTQPVLEQSLLGPEVRIRMGWKPMPPEVLEQDRDNPPPVHTAVTFDRICDVIREFRKQGIDHAEFCLVGWNRGGHDGQFPDLLPVEEAFGGEEALKRLTAFAAQQGYLIGAHTNIHDSYSSAERWRREDMLKDKNGEVVKGGQWCGGQSYLICPEAVHEKILPEDMNTLKSLGFNGTHYFDVTSMITPQPCYDKVHPLTRKEAAQWRAKSFELARKYFGAVSSEGSLDYAIGSYDYALYAVFGAPKELPPMCDRTFPFRHIVYHGIIHYNLSAATVNAPLKDDRKLPLLNLAYGGRPMFYYYSKFRKDSPWGNRDLLCGTEKELREGVEIIRQDYERYKKMRDLQYEFIDDILEPAENVVVTVYGNGTRTIFNGSDCEFRYETGDVIPPLTLARFSPEHEFQSAITI